MRPSHWRQVSAFEVLVLAAFFVASGLVLILPMSLDILVRFSFAVAFIVGDIPVFLEVDRRARAREWHDFYRPMTAYFVGYSLVRLSHRFLAQEPGVSIKYRERTKELLITMGLADPSLLSLVDKLETEHPGLGDFGVYNEIWGRLIHLLTDRELQYSEFWRIFTWWVAITGDESGTVFHGAPSTAAKASVRSLEDSWERFRRIVLYIEKERNPYLPSVYRVLATQIHGAKHLWLPDTQVRLVAETLQANEKELDRIWGQLVTGEL